MQHEIASHAPGRGTWQQPCCKTGGINGNPPQPRSHLRVDALVHEDGDHVAEKSIKLNLALLVRHLQLALFQDDEANGTLVGGPKHGLQVLLGCQDTLRSAAGRSRILDKYMQPERATATTQRLLHGRTYLGHVGKHRLRLQNLIQVLLDAVPPIQDLVLVAGDLKALPSLAHPARGVWLRCVEARPPAPPERAIFKHLESPRLFTMRNIIDCVR